jgi:putative transposase
MARPLRMFAPGSYLFITDRCHEERHLLRPDRVVLQIVAAALTAAIDATGVGLLAFVVMGNHWHLLVRIPDDVTALPCFMQRLKSTVARQVNAHLGRRGTFWSERYHSISVVDDASLLERMTYILMNPVAAGLAASASEYPGLSSLEANVGVRAACPALDLPIALLPQWAELTKDQLALQRAWLGNELQTREEAVKCERRERGLPRPKVERCLAVDPFDRPACPARRRAPRCFAATLEARKAFGEIRKAFIAAYRWASDAFRGGVVDVMFPAGSFPPRLLQPLVAATC